MIEVTLTWQEVARAAHVGVQRQISSLSKRLVDQHGFTGDGWGVHIEGALGIDAKKEEWKAEHGGREAAYFVPKSALRPMQELQI